VHPEVISAFREATFAVFQKMLDAAVACGEAQTTREVLANHCVTGIIGLTGGMAGDVIIRFDEEVAMEATGLLLGETPSEFDNNVVDAVGELTNMIAGGAKGMLEQYNMSLALPTVIFGRGHRVGFRSGVQPVTLPFTTDWGGFCVDLGLIEAEVPLPS